MGLIINDKIQMLIKGYPTVSDKYNVVPAVLGGTTPVKFGELVKYSGTKGYVEAITSTITAADIAGIVVATNVKLAKGFAVNEVETEAGEPLNLLLNGYLAIELASSAVEDDIAPNKEVKVVLADGTFTTASVTSGTVSLPNAVFTGTWEKHGTTKIAEIYVK